MLNIDKLLKKKGWTGAELGKLQIANILLAYQKALETGDPNEKGLVSKAEFKKMLSTITDPIEGRTYNGYISIAEWISNTLQMAIAQEQQAELQFNKLWEILSNAITAEDIYSYIEELPVIMTEKQYKDFIEKRTHEILHPEETDPDGVGIADNVIQLVVDVIDYYASLLKESPDSVNPLKPLKKKLEQEPVKDPRILENYNRVFSIGYYTTEDGTRSDEVTPTEWRRKVNPLISEYLEAEEIGDKEALQIKETILQKRLLNDASLMYVEGLTEEEAQRKRRNEEARQGLVKLCKWHYYEDQPEDLNKWEIIESGYLPDFYPYYLTELTEEEAIEVCEDFYNEFKEVVEIIIKDIVKKYPSLKGIEKLPVKEWFSTAYSWETLYNMDFYNFRSECVGDLQIFEDNKRALTNGIAIIRPSDLGLSTRIDPKTGYYIAPDIKKTLKDISLEGLFSEEENYTDNTERVEDARNTFISSLYFLKGFNTALDLINSYYGIEEVNIIKRNIPHFEEKVQSFNELITLLYRRISNTYYEDNEIKEKKLGVLKDIFYPIDLKKTDVPQERIDETKGNMKDFKAFREDTYSPTNTLCMYISDYEEETHKDGEGV
jgi:hypothetical protein